MGIFILESVKEMDRIYGQTEDPNLLGFLRRCPESEYYRRHGAGMAPDYPTEREVRHAIMMARFNLKIKAQIALNKK
jgi:hypothetical protein